MPFSQHYADVAANFFECLLKHTADEYWGKPFLLAPWQEECLSAIFGNVDDDGNRLVQLAYIEVPKKAGKTEMVAGIVLLALILDKNPGCQIYGAAAATRQAMNVYRAAAKMVEQSPELSKRLRVMRGTNRIVKRSDRDSFYAAIAADGDFSDGINPSVVIADELHRWRTRKAIENWDVLRLGGITRKQTLTIAITTAGVQSESPLAWALHEKTRKIEQGVVEDPAFFGRIWGANEDDDIADPKTWIKANPSFQENGGFLELRKYHQTYQSALSNPDEMVAFKRYYLNLWGQKENRAIDMAQWKACRMDWQAKPLLQEPAPGATVRSLPHEVLAHFVERRCWVGVDLSMSIDLSAITIVFPRESGGVDVLCFPYMPEGKLRPMGLRDGMPYERWAREGWLETNPGNVVDYGPIHARLKWIKEMFDVQEWCFDQYNSREMSTQFSQSEGVTCLEINQGFSGISEATKKFLSLIASGEMGHGNHPVFNHHASCLCVKANDDGLMKPIKSYRDREHSRIDLCAATITAMARAIVAMDTKSVYETRGVLSF